ncbi:MAG: yycF [Clostridiales bacterium]|jgi:two-component system response regulator VicR|nr:yycF [Clostridiales bacterium]
MAKILVVDDERAIVDILEFNLKKEGHEVVLAYDGIEAIEKVEKENPELILLDLMMPRLDGIETCKRLRKNFSTPIIMLTAKAEEVDKVLGLELGADDYVTKPFGVRELMARVKANLRRTVVDTLHKVEISDGKKTKYGSIVIDIERFEILKRGKTVDLTVREFELVKFLAGNKDQIFSREQLLEKVWGYEYFGDVRTVDVTIRRLREKLEDNPAEPMYVLTKRGIGYYFNNEEV